MDNFNTIQGTIRDKRKVFETAEREYYHTLQKWSLAKEGIVSGTGAAPTPAQVDAKRTSRDAALNALQQEIQNLTKQGAPQQLLENIPASLSFLLMPVRVEARYVNLMHVVRQLSLNEVVDVAAMPDETDSYLDYGFEKDDEGVWTYEITPLRITEREVTVHPEVVEKWKPFNGKYIRKKDDQPELRIRLYPDDFFLEGHEPSLQPDERAAGRTFWQLIWEGKDPQETWVQFSTERKPARAAWIIRATRPLNFTEGQPLPATPQFDDSVPLKDGTYTYPLISRLLPEQFVVRLYKDGKFKEFTGKPIPEPLLLGLDPTRDPFDQQASSGMSEGGSSIKTPDYLEWVHNFEAAEKQGMALRVDLLQHPEFTNGVDKIIVAGAKLSASESEGSRLLHEQLEDHLYREEGMAILPKGTPTNNFAKNKVPFQQKEQDALRYFRSGWTKPSAHPDGLTTDEQVLKKMLGLNNDLYFPGGASADSNEAAMMNELLWPATMGYYLLQFFTPQLTEASREQARQFFIKHVSARGHLPVLRVNRQPYGIIPVSSFEHWQYGAAPLPEEEKFASALWTNFLVKLNKEWDIMTSRIFNVRNVSGVGLDDRFFEMLGLSPAAGQLQRQWMAGADFQQMLKTMRFSGTGVNDPSYIPANFINEYNRMGLNAADFNVLTNTYPSPLQQIFRSWLDGLPVSETEPLARIPSKAWNLFQWLANGKFMDLWTNNIAAIPTSIIPGGSAGALTSVLAMIARQAVLRTYYEAAIKMVEPRPGFQVIRLRDFETLNVQIGSYTNVVPGSLTADNRLHMALAPFIQQYNITETFTVWMDRLAHVDLVYPWTEGKTFIKYIDEKKKTTTVLPTVRAMIRNLEYFAKTPTARLQRLVTEHFDLCSHRLDAWMLGLVNQRLVKQREVKPTGIGLGAFGYLLNLKPGTSTKNVVVEVTPEYIPATAANLEEGIIPVVHSAGAKALGIDLEGNGWQRCFLYIGDTSTPVLRLNTINGKVEPDQVAAKSDGYIHAPSTSHATAAAMLRSAYLNHPADNQTALLAIQLNSPRTRKALQMLEGMQQGVSIGELLGHYYERILHDNKKDGLIRNLRIGFPLKRLEGTDKNTPPMTTIDGMALLKARRENLANWTSPFLTNPTEIANANTAAAQLEDYLDALGDLLLAESVYQTAKGNTERAAAALRILNEGGQVETPGIVQTPMQGTTITHRIGVVMSTPPSTADWQGWPKSGTPRASLNPDINYWLSLRLPLPSKIAIAVTLPQQQKQKILLTELGIEPIDLVFAMPGSFATGQQSPLAMYVQTALITKLGVAHLTANEPIVIDFKDRSLHAAGELSIFEISSLVTSLRKLIMESRSLGANDFLLPDKAAAAADKTDVTRLLTAMKKQFIDNAVIPRQVAILRDQANRLRIALQQQKPDTILQPHVKAIVAALQSAWQRGVENSGTGGIYSLQKEVLTQLCTLAEQTASQLELSFAKAQQQMQAIPADAKGEPLFQTLQQIAQKVFGNTVPLLPDFKLENVTEVLNCIKGKQHIEGVNADIIDNWMGEASLVRKPLRVHRNTVLLSETLAPEKPVRNFEALQFPFIINKKQPWAGGKVSETLPAEQRPAISLLMELPTSYDPAKMYTGFLIDEWPEWTPSKTADTGVAFQYNQPNTEPPQTLLLAVSPVESGNWKWDYLVGAVNNALDLSKKRLVTPQHIRESNSGLNQLLPALLLPFMGGEQTGPVVESFQNII